MTKEQKTILREALLQVELENLQPYRPDEEVTFSPEFEARMEKLIRAQKRLYWRFTNTLGKRVAIAAAAALVVLSATMSISAIREPVVDFVVEIWEDFVRVFVDDETTAAPTSVESVHVFKEVPEGYVMVGQEEMKMAVETRWEKGSDWMSLTQEVVSADNLTLDNDGIQDIWELDKWQVYHAISEEYHTYVWVTDQYFYTLTCTENLEKEAITQLISNIE